MIDTFFAALEGLALTWTAVGIALGVLLVVMIFSIVWRRRPKKLKKEYYQQKWQKLQSQLSDSKLWPLAIIDADKLLEEALKTRRYKGKSMGEKLVAAQHDIQNNDLVWFGHKLRNKLVHEPDVKLKKTDVRDALLGIKTALKDLGAFREK